MPLVKAVGWCDSHRLADLDCQFRSATSEGTLQPEPFAIGPLAGGQVTDKSILVLLTFRYMGTKNASIKVLAADVTRDGLIVHFSDETSVLYHAHFLHDVRNDDGNVALSDANESDEAE